MFGFGPCGIDNEYVTCQVLSSFLSFVFLIILVWFVVYYHRIYLCQPAPDLLKYHLIFFSYSHALIHLAYTPITCQQVKVFDLCMFDRLCFSFLLVDENDVIFLP